MKRALSFLLIIFLSSNWCALYSQDVEKLPQDPRVKSGKLANGLTYYIFKNAGNKGHADFILAQKVGKNMEEGNQQGMLSMLELLALRGTRNFPDSTITTYLKRLGLEAKDISFNTGANNSIYSITNVPVKNTNVLDSTLLILYNWMNSINIDNEDIDKASTLFKNKMLNYWTAQNRMDYKKEQQFLLKKAKEDYPWINTPKFTSKELRNFYYKWFRPDIQAIIVVGDIDTASVRTRITSLFSTIPKPLEKKPQFSKFKADTSNIINIQKDKEFNKISITLDFIKPILPAKYKLTSVPFIQEYMTGAILTLLQARIEDGIRKNNLPVWNIMWQEKPISINPSNESISVTFETLPENVYTTLNFLSSEIDRMAKFGFNGQEFIKSKDIYYRDLEQLYDTRFNQNNNIFSKRIIDNYLDGFSLASIELKFEIMKEILYSITNTQLNEYAKALLGRKENISITCYMPDSQNVDDVSKDRLYSTFKESLATTAKYSVEKEAVRWPKIITREGIDFVISETQDPMTGSYIYQLSNGATIVFKQTLDSKDTISVRAVSKGGFSMMEGVNLSNEHYMSDLVNLGGLADMPQPDIKRLYSYNNMDVTAKILQDKELVEGYAARESVEELFKAVYLNFASRRKDVGVFDLYKKAKLFEYEYNSLAPQKVFADTITFYNNSNKRYVGKITESDIKRLDYDKIFAQTQKRYENAADFIFIFTGNLDPNIIKTLASKYLGLLQGDESLKETGYIIPNYLTKGRTTKYFLNEMTVPRSYLNITYSVGIPYEIKSFILAKICGEYLNNAILSSPIKNITSDITSKSILLNYPEDIFVFNMNFIADSAGTYKIKEEYTNLLNGIANKGVDLDLFNKCISDLVINFNKNKNTNTYWNSILENKFMNQKDFNTDYLKVLESVSITEFNAFIYSLIKTGNMIEVMMEGTTEDVKTRNLFRDDVFVRDFFSY